MLLAFDGAHLAGTITDPIGTTRLESLGTCRLESRRYVMPTFLSAGPEAFQPRVSGTDGMRPVTLGR